jgi:hypothetical protein
MMPTGFPRLLRSTTIGLLRGLRLTLATAATVWLSAPTVSHAGMIVDYVFSNASAVLNGAPVSITGFVSMVPALHSELRADIQITGPTPYAGLYQNTAYLELPQLLDYLGEPNLVEAGNLQIRFANNLSSFSNDPLASVEIVTGSGAVVASDAAPTGGAVVTGGSIGYVFSNASAVLNGVPLSYSGFFEFDPLTHVEWEALIQVMGPAPYAGTCFLDTERALADLVDAMCPGFSQYLTQFHFANDLSSFAADRLDYIQNGSFYDFAPTGFALPPGVAAPVPEPASLALLGVALGLFLLNPQGLSRFLGADEAGGPRSPARRPKTWRAPIARSLLRISACGR